MTNETLVFKFDKDVLNRGMNAMGITISNTAVTSFDRDTPTTVFVGPGIGTYELKSAAANVARNNVMRQSGEMYDVVHKAVARKEDEANRAASHRRPAAKVSRGVAAAARAYDPSRSH